MNDIHLGQLVSVDLREVFLGEASHFTPWLAAEDNLALLGDAIGLDLELVGIEQSVGPYRADIVCKDTLRDSVVLVENQLEKTDHTHLGQILTYAAKFHAVTVVWIARRFTEEHRAALDWLNNSTVSDVQFFGLEVELWRIGNSAAAPKFNIISQPNEWVKTASPGQVNTSNISGTQEWQLAYWTAFREFVLSRSPSVIKPRKPLPQQWTNFAIGHSYFDLSATVVQAQNRIRISLGIYGPNENSHFHLLKSSRTDIETEIGETLDWLELPARKSSYVSLYLEPANPIESDDWSRQHTWMLDRLEKFHHCFAPRVKALTASEWDPQE